MRGKYFLLLRLPGRKSGSPRFGLPQERDATLSKSTSVRSDRHLVRRRYVAEADREHALCEWDDWSHHALPLESGGGVDDVQGTVSVTFGVKSLTFTIRRPLVRR